MTILIILTSFTHGVNLMEEANGGVCEICCKTFSSKIKWTRRTCPLILLLICLPKPKLIKLTGVVNGFYNQCV